jgi:hypothetical protein
MSDAWGSRLRRGTAVGPGTPGRTAQQGLLALAVVSVTIRPVVDVLGLPRFLVNLDALLTPLVAAAVVLVTLAGWSTVSRGHRGLTALVGALGLSLALSWVAGTPRSVPTLGLGAAMVLLLPLVLYVVVMATTVPLGDLIPRTLLLLVVLQLLVGLVQYVALEVAQKAPFAADLVDGTTSHNLWPVFALPASLVVALTRRDWLRYVVPGSVALLAVYAEAKAALLVWLPLMVLLLGAGAIGDWRRRRPAAADGRPRWGADALAGAGVAAAAGGLLVVGLWWTPSVQGTWEVLLGHSHTLEQFTVSGAREETVTAPTLRDGISTVADELTSGPRELLLGLGPANTTSHAAEVLAQGAQNGVSLPAPGPVAAELLSGTDPIKFRDAQSSALGLWGDLGTLGVLLYAAACLFACYLLAAPRGLRRAAGSVRAWTVLSLVGGLFVGGTLLDWPEQASAVLPVALALAVLTGGRAGALPSDEAATRVAARPRVRRVAPAAQASP